MSAVPVQQRGACFETRPLILSAAAGGVEGRGAPQHEVIL
jgi:hypothetical protein